MVQAKNPNVLGFAYFFYITMYNHVGIEILESKFVKHLLYFVGSAAASKNYFIHCFKRVYNVVL